jgi:hypothetical protein
MELIEQTVADELTRSLKNSQPGSGIQAEGQGNEAAISVLLVKRKRIEDGYEAGLYTLEGSLEKTRLIDQQIEQLRDETYQRERSQAQQLERQQLLTDLSLIGDLGEWIRTDDSRTVNNILRKLCTKIIIHPGPRAEIEFG